MNLVKILDMSLYQSAYEWCSQEDFLKRLSDEGISVTSQTCRNWERNNLITPPRRVKMAEGRRVEYCEYALAESFAVYYLTTTPMMMTISGMELQLPRFSLKHLSLARQKFCEEHYRVLGYPEPPAASYRIHYLSFPDGDSEVAGLPSIGFHVQDDGTVATDENPHLDAKNYLEHQLIQSIYGAWYYALMQGCQRFLSAYAK